jgi:hypothetical protein
MLCWVMAKTKAVPRVLFGLSLMALALPMFALVWMAEKSGLMSGSREGR